MPGTTDVRYFVLSDGKQPYLLAQVRWPDVFQAISAGRPYWQEDPGLFDLPYDPSSTSVTLEQADAIAAEWGARLPSDETTRTFEPTLIRRMPADWSNLAPAEKRAWSLEFLKPGATIGDEIVIHRSAVGPLASWLGRYRRRRQTDSPLTAPSRLEHTEDWTLDPDGVAVDTPEPRESVDPETEPAVARARRRWSA